MLTVDFRTKRDNGGTVRARRAIRVGGAMAVCLTLAACSSGSTSDAVRPASAAVTTGSASSAPVTSSSSGSAGSAAGADGLARVRGWLRGSSLDAWVIERELQDAAQYAETWIRDGGTRPGTPEFDELYSAWLDDFEARAVTQVGFGYVLLRRPARPARPARAAASSAPLRRFERLDDRRYDAARVWFLRFEG